MHVDFDERGEPIRLHLSRHEWKECAEFDEPNWEPLERHVPEEIWGNFMWMYRIRPEGQGIEAYKHRDTRRYLHLDHNGRAWRWHPDGTWTRISVTQALAETFDLRTPQPARTVNRSTTHRVP